MNDSNGRTLRLDPGILVALIVCGLAIWPFISRSSLPQATDAELHIFRAAELGRLLEAGESFPRWAPNFYYGFGYPIFNYYAPLSYYVALVPGLLLQFDVVDGVKLVFVLGSLLGGLGVYGYVSRIWGRMPALVATGAYAYAPFIVFVDPHARGDLAEAFSFAIFPLALWALDRLRCCPKAWNWLISVALIAALTLSHNLMALVFAVIIAGWSIWQELVSGVPPALPASSDLATRLAGRLLRLRLFLALIIGVGVAAFFWLTVFLERNAVDLGSLIGDGGNFDYRNHFLSLEELLSPPTLLDWAATEPDFVLGLGTVQWILAALGVGLLAAGRAPGRKQAAFFAILAGILLFLMSPASRFVWDFLPFLPFLQFPWRLLGPQAFALAALSGVATAGLMRSMSYPLARWIPASLVGLIMLSSLPLSQVPPWPADFGPTTAVRVLEEELAGRWLGTTSTSDFVPSTVDAIPKPEQALLADFFAGRPLDRVNRVTLPEGAVVRSEEITPLHFRYDVKSETSFLLRLFLFDFPGWVVRVDGVAVEAELGRPEGFIVIPLEEGHHIVEVMFVDTDARGLAKIVSTFFAILAMVIAFWLWTSRAILTATSDRSPPVCRGGAAELLIVSAVAIMTFGANVLLLEPKGWIRLESADLTAIPAQNDHYAELGEQIALIGYDAPSTGASGSAVPFTAYWQALRPPEANYQVFVHLLDNRGQVVAQSDALNPGDFPTKRWPTDRYVRDEHDVILPGDLPAGEYQWSIGLWSAGEGRRLPVVDSAGLVLGDSVYLPGQLTIE